MVPVRCAASRARSGGAMSPAGQVADLCIEGSYTDETKVSIRHSYIAYSLVGLLAAVAVI